MDTDEHVEQLPENHIWQISPSQFRWSILTESQAFQRYLDCVRTNNLLSDPCVYRDSGSTVTAKDYPLVVQKSPLWLDLRKRSLGTGSSLGKYLKTRNQYPTSEQVTDAWREKFAGEVFAPDTAAQGHMRWGNNYEEPAAIHFAVNHYYRVTAVGCIRLPVAHIRELMAQDARLGDKEQWPNDPAIMDGQLLISPDGLISNVYTDWPLGLLEIKCISPFHHVAEADGRLTWVADMERRQWRCADQIPVVYLIQLGLQALAAQYHYVNLRDRTDCDDIGAAKMWFIRWSPAGYSEFSAPLSTLVPIGIISTQLYLLLLVRLPNELNQAKQLNYTKAEQVILTRLEQALDVARVELDSNYGYIEHSSMYPEFQFYRDITKHHRFTMTALEQVP